MKQKKLLRLTPLVVVMALPTIGALALLARPGVMESTSPNGQLVARVTSPSVLSLLIDPDDKNRD